MPLGRDAGLLSQRALRGLKSYRYQSAGTTWLDDAHQPFWNFCVNRMPVWLAPNLITLAGTLAVVAAYALNVYYNPSFTGEAPTWVYLLTALSVAVYVNLDCMDGKQARRTGSSSPLGQLFDHGCDALALHMMLGNIASSLGVGCGWKMAAGCLGIMVPWMLAQWEEFHTGVMMYGNDFYGVLEANYSICAVHLLSAAFGLRFWRTELTLPAPVFWPASSSSSSASSSSSVLSLVLGAVLPAAAGDASDLSFAGGNATAAAEGMVMSVGGGVVSLGAVRTTVAEVALVAVGLAGVLQGVTNVVRVFSAPPLPPQEAGHKKLGTRWALLHLMGLLATVLLGAASVAWSPCAALTSASTTSSSPSASSTTSSFAAPSPTSSSSFASSLTSAPPSFSSWLGGNSNSGAVGGDRSEGLVASWSSDATLCRASFSTFGVLYALAATQLIVAHMAKEPWGPSLAAIALPTLSLAAAAAAASGGWGLGWGAAAAAALPARLVLSAHVVAVAVYLNYVTSVISQICAHLGVKCLTIVPRLASPSPSPPPTPAPGPAGAAGAATAASSAPASPRAAQPVQ